MKVRTLMNTLKGSWVPIERKGNIFVVKIIVEHPTQVAASRCSSAR